MKNKKSNRAFNKQEINIDELKEISVELGYNKNNCYRIYNLSSRVSLDKNRDPNLNDAFKLYQHDIREIRDFGKVSKHILEVYLQRKGLI